MGSLREVVQRAFAGWAPRAAVCAAAVLALLAGVYFAGIRLQHGYSPQAGPSEKAPKPSSVVAARPGEVPFTSVAKLAPSVQQRPRFFALRPLERRPQLEPNIDVLSSALLGDRRTTYALPSARLVSTEEQ
jgi:hypothetical protein